MRIRGPVLSLILHASVVFALIHIAAVQQTPLNKRQPHVDWSSTKLVWHLPDSPKPGGADSGGGGRMQLPASRGQLPRQTPHAFVPPTTQRPEEMPALPVEPALIGQIQTPVVRDIGMPGGVIGPPSDGPGSGGGIGPGQDGGVGPGRGPKAPGDGGTGSGGRARIATRQDPVLVYKVEPEFTEEARKARLEGVVVLIGDVNEQGTVDNIRVQQGLGLGLDEKAMEAVRKWRFRPGLRDGKPARQPVLIEVRFHLL